MFHNIRNKQGKTVNSQISICDVLGIWIWPVLVLLHKHIEITYVFVTKIYQTCINPILPVSGDG